MVKREHTGGHMKRLFAESTFILSVGLIIIFLLHRVLFGTFVLCVGGVVLMSGLFIPIVYSRIRRLGKMLAKGVGIGMSWLLLLPFFYVCFTFGRLILFILRKDPLQRTFPSKAQSYWIPREKTSGVEHYRRQY